MLSKDVDSKQCEIHAQVLKPIIELKTEEPIKQAIQEKSFPIEYHFWIENYRENEINEVNFDYTIEIENSIDDFPVSYELIDCDSNQLIKLVNGKSEKMTISKSVKESRQFKLRLEWRELDGEMAEDLEIKLKINVIQRKE